MQSTHRRAPLLLERTLEKIRARKMLKVLSTESYRTATVVSGWILTRTDGEYRFPPPHHDSQEGTNQQHDQSTY